MGQGAGHAAGAAVPAAPSGRGDAALRTLPPMSKTQVMLLTTLAMIAFAANSLLCRIALREAHIDAASFTAVRLAAGALTLWLT